MTTAEGKLVALIEKRGWASLRSERFRVVSVLSQTGRGAGTAEKTNFLVVKGDTPIAAVEHAFNDFTSRDDIGIILINQHVANEIRHLLKAYTKTIPTVLEMPSKDQPYDPKQDYIMQRVSAMLNADV